MHNKVINQPPLDPPEKNTTSNNVSEIFADFLRLESAGGILLFICAILAMICANTPLIAYYELLLSVPLGIKLGELEVIKPLLLWINDGLMAIFFLMVGLELKRELLEGELADKRNIILPGVGAVGGMLIPALIFIYFNYDDPQAISGWAIPAATDIAFALGVLSLLGSRVPTAIKVFLTSLAIFDDIGAIVIIAIFYTEQISLLALLIVACCVPLLFGLNYRHVVSRSPYILIGIIMWVATLKSGVHATLAGVVLAMFIPIQPRPNSHYSPLKDMEQDLHRVVAFFILPVFAFANAGINLTGITMEQLLHGVPMGIALGLFFGKQIGIFGFCGLAIKLGWCSLPKHVTWLGLYGTAALCGIGFTMSLFIGSLAYENTGIDLLFDERLGIIIGSCAAGLLGYCLIKISLK